jgi:hypothetical protein
MPLVKLDEGLAEATRGRSITATRGNCCDEVVTLSALAIPAIILGVGITNVDSQMEMGRASDDHQRSELTQASLTDAAADVQPPDQTMRSRSFRGIA